MLLFPSASTSLTITQHQIQVEQQRLQFSAMAIKRIVPIIEAGSSSSATTPDSSPTEAQKDSENVAPGPKQATGDSIAESSPSPHMDAEGLQLNAWSLSHKNLTFNRGLMVKVEPPKEPRGVPKNYHVPCDIVLLIDVSGSMTTPAVASVKEGEVREDDGFNTLDLVKHAALTIMATLDERDRLGIVKFSGSAHVVAELKPMNSANKQSARVKLLALRPEDATKMWDGIAKGLKVFEKSRQGSNRIPALLLLTDGVPTDTPPNGWVNKLKTKQSSLVPIHTFGFGYQLQSGVLKSIAEYTGGHYAFIPECTMIGTVFIHAVANLQSTFATDAKLKINFPANIKLKAAIGKSLQVTSVDDVELDRGQETNRAGLVMGLGALQFGMSKDVYFEYGDLEALEACIPADQAITVQLSYKTVSGEWCSSTIHRNPLEPSMGPAAEMAYHVSRSMLCKFLSSISPFLQDGERRRYRWGQQKTLLEDRIPVDSDTGKLLDKEKEAMPAWGLATSDEDCASLIQDIEGHEPHGQVSLAVSRAEFWDRWGGHYLLSLLDAHTRQACNSFKDPGPQRYGLGSPLFVACRERLNEAFEAVEVPPPSRPPPYSHGGTSRRDVTAPGFSMTAFYNNFEVPCFAGDMHVRLAAAAADEGNGSGDATTTKWIPISSLGRGVRLLTPLGPRAVAAVLRTKVRDAPVCRVGGVVVTPWHPVKKAAAAAGAAAGDNAWAFPAEMPGASPALYTGSVFSVLLEPDTRPEAHAFLVSPGPGGDDDGPAPALWGVALGHGLVGTRKRGGESVAAAAATLGGGTGDAGDDVRTHEFWGDYGRVAAELARLPGAGGVVLCGGARRSGATGRVVGLRLPSRGPARSRAAVRKLRVRLARSVGSLRTGLVSAA